MLKSVQLPNCIKPESSKGYNPSFDTLTHEATLKTRQVRRIHYLQHLIDRFCQHDPSETHLNQACIEWQAILGAKGYLPTFATWCASHPDLGWCPVHVPDLPYINALYEQVKADCDNFHNKVRRARDADFPKIIHTDLHHHGGKLSYALIREPSRPPVDQVLHPETCHAQMLRHKGKNGTFRLKVPCGFQCSPGQHIECNSNPGVITCVERQCITVMGTAPSTPHVKCQVKNWITDPQKVGGNITAYWNQFWQRDTIEESISLDEWSQCVQNVDQHISQHETIYSNGRDLQLWRAAIKATQKTVRQLEDVVFPNPN